jgi:hypothetical protein
MGETVFMRSSDATSHSTGELALSEPSDPEPALSETGTLSDFQREIRLEELARQRSFRQHAAVAVIVGLAALTLVLIVRVDTA